MCCLENTHTTVIPHKRSIAARIAGPTEKSLR